MHKGWPTGEKGGITGLHNAAFAAASARQGSVVSPGVYTLLETVRAPLRERAACGPSHAQTLSSSSGPTAPGGFTLRNPGGVLCPLSPTPTHVWLLLTADNHHVPELPGCSHKPHVLITCPVSEAVSEPPTGRCMGGGHVQSHPRSNDQLLSSRSL